MKKSPLVRSRPLVYAITDRSRLPNPSQPNSLTEFIRDLLLAGVDMIQIREKDLSARSLLAIADDARAQKLAIGSATTRILINDRADLAAASDAGVHLTTRSLECATIRPVFKNLLIGVSTHNEREVEAAEKGGADFVVFGPVFETESKRQYGSPAGLAALARAVSLTALPVIGLGGITLTNCAQVIGAGAAGIAGISMFTDSTDLRLTVAGIRNRLSSSRPEAAI